MEMFISFFSGKGMLFFGISLIMKEKSNASALTYRMKNGTQTVVTIQPVRQMKNDICMPSV